MSKKVNNSDKLRNFVMLFAAIFLLFAGSISVAKKNFSFLNVFILFLGLFLLTFYFGLRGNKNFKPFDRTWQDLQSKKMVTWLDKLTYPKIFLIWISTIVVFGFFYFLLSSEKSFLTYSLKQETVKNLVDHLYFSFITATTTGFGDIVPIGLFKLIAIIEVVFGLVLFALVTSKLVSIKQDIILTEIYEISFNERLNRLRSSMIVFRQNLLRIISKIEDATVSKREIRELYTYLHSLENVLSEVSTFYDKKGKRGFLKNIDSLNTELVFNSIMMSFQKLNDLLTELNNNDIEWRREITLNIVNRCLKLIEALFEKLDSSRILPEKNLDDLYSQKDKVIKSIKKELALKKY